MDDMQLAKPLQPSILITCFIILPLSTVLMEELFYLKRRYKYEE